MAGALGRVITSSHCEVAWLEPRTYCLVPLGVWFTSSDASPQTAGVTNVAVAGRGGNTCTGAIHGTVPKAEIMTCTRPIEGRRTAATRLSLCISHCFSSVTASTASRSEQTAPLMPTLAAISHGALAVLATECE